MHNPAVLAPLISRVNTSFCWVRQPGEPPGRRDFPIDDEIIAGHLAGRYSIGACPITPGTSTTRCAVLDFDSHKGATPWSEMLDVVRGVIEALHEKNLRPAAFRSSGGAGVHLVLLWERPQDAYTVREELKIALGKCGLRVGTEGVAKKEVEIFPKQDGVPADGFGSMFLLPLSQKSTVLWMESEQ
jgi:hypothetical protein